jgi:hypothetical protein
MGDPGFLPQALRYLASAFCLLGAAALLVLALRRPSSRPAAPSAPGPLAGSGPRRPAVADLAALIDRARTRPYARDRVAERLRAVAREAVALRLGIDEAKAREAIDCGDWEGDPRVAAFLARDFMEREDMDACSGGSPASPDWKDFGQGLEGSLGFLEGYASPGRGEGGDEGEEG